jgi:hypothetical protein
MAPEALPATRATLDMIAALDVRVVIPGHGEAFTDVRAGIGPRLSPHRGIRRRRHAHGSLRAQALLAFTLLARRSMAIADLPSYVERIGVYRDIERGRAAHDATGARPDARGRVAARKCHPRDGCDDQSRLATTHRLE